MKYFQSKVNKLVEDIPLVNTDPLSTLKEAFIKWGTNADTRPIFNLRESTLLETVNAIAKSSLLHHN